LFILSLKMAKTKRNRVVPLTKTKKGKGFEKKDHFITKVQESIKQYTYTYLFRYKNLTTSPLQALRNYWEDSKFLLGKTRVMQVAFGKNEDDTFIENSHKLSGYLRGNTGLFFSNQIPDYVIEYLVNITL